MAGIAITRRELTASALRGVAGRSKDARAARARCWRLRWFSRTGGVHRLTSRGRPPRARRRGGSCAALQPAPHQTSRRCASAPSAPPRNMAAPPLPLRRTESQQDLRDLSSDPAFDSLWPLLLWGTDMAVAFADTWSELSLAAQFAVAGGVVLATAAVVAGFFISGRIEEAVVRNTASSTALYMDSFVAPLTQELASRPNLSARSRAEIGRLLSATALGQRVVSFKIWREDGLLVDASNTDLVGQRFALTENLVQAWKGEVRADFDDTGDAEDVAEHALGLPLLEIYAPIRDMKT